MALLASLFTSGAAQAGPGDQSRSHSKFLSGSLLSAVDLEAVVGLGGATTENLGQPATVVDAADLDVTALSLINLGLPGGLDLPLLGELLVLGAVNQYSASSDQGVSRAASGAVSNDGAVSLNDESAFPANAALNLTPLLEAAGLDSVLDQVSLDLEAVTGVAALSPNAGAPAVACTELSNPVHCLDYSIAGAELVVGAPVLGNLVTVLTGAGGVVSLVDTALNGLVGPDGALAAVLAGLNAALAPLLGNDLVNITITADVNGAINGF